MSILYFSIYCRAEGSEEAVCIKIEEPSETFKKNPISSDHLDMIFAPRIIAVAREAIRSSTQLPESFPPAPALRQD